LVQCSKDTPIGEKVCNSLFPKVLLLIDLKKKKDCSHMTAVSIELPAFLLFN